MADPMDSFFNPDFTYSYSKYSCLKAAYAPHITFAYLVGLTGLGCLVTRLIPAFKPAHVWFGRLYIISMLWCMAFSLLIHNTGLPASTLLSFLWVLIGLSLGWLLIKVHQARMDKAALLRVQATIKLQGLHGDLVPMVAQAKADIASEKSFWQRFLSLKTLHGLLFFTSWINIVGRIVVTNPSKDFTCHTYPYYKPIDPHGIPGANASLTPVPTHDPQYDRLPWAKTGDAMWGVLLSVGPLAVGAVFGALWSGVVAYCAARRRPPANPSHSEPAEGHLAFAAPKEG